MAFTTISNGDVPDADILMANFNYLAGGAGIKSDTYAALIITAAAAPTTAFLCIATDSNLFLLYTGDVTAGDGGFVTLSSWVPGGIT